MKIYFIEFNKEYEKKIKSILGNDATTYRSSSSVKNNNNNKICLYLDSCSVVFE